MSKQEYASHITRNKDYWIHVNTIELENDLDFRSRFDGSDRQLEILTQELTRKRNEELSASVIEWADAVLDALTDDLEPTSTIPAWETTTQFETIPNVVTTTASDTSRHSEGISNIASYQRQELGVFGGLVVSSGVTRIWC